MTKIAPLPCGRRATGFGRSGPAIRPWPAWLAPTCRPEHNWSQLAPSPHWQRTFRPQHGRSPCKNCGLTPYHIICCIHTGRAALSMAQCLALTSLATQPGCIPAAEPRHQRDDQPCLLQLHGVSVVGPAMLLLQQMWTTVQDDGPNHLGVCMCRWRTTRSSGRGWPIWRDAAFCPVTMSMHVTTVLLLWACTPLHMRSRGARSQLKPFLSGQGPMIKMDGGESLVNGVVFETHSGNAPCELAWLSIIAPWRHRVGEIFPERAPSGDQSSLLDTQDPQSPLCDGGGLDSIMRIPRCHALMIVSPNVPVLMDV